jgi:hypothetical protein
MYSCDDVTRRDEVMRFYGISETKNREKCTSADGYHQIKPVSETKKRETCTIYETKNREECR